MSYPTASSSRRISRVSDPRFQTRFRTRKQRIIAAAILAGDDDATASAQAGSNPRYGYMVRRAIEGVCVVPGCTRPVEGPTECQICRDTIRKMGQGRGSQVHPAERTRIAAWLTPAQLQEREVARQAIARKQRQSARRTRSLMERPVERKVIRGRDILLGSDRRGEALRRAQAGTLRF